ncbi:glutamyl-tRNA reductase [Deinococcus pimensis]|uniref:glutamyl-tRNA reductase n=1 Tax=Deinococcus pimensis TaxID=309888 RepID=UPI0004BB35A2|nr:glutamyl-tRNA reductase [Deinococcus pimensis]
MDISVIGINHRSAPLDAQEHASVDPADAPLLNRALHAYAEEVMLLATCGRTEIYLAGQADLRAVHASLWPHLKPAHTYHLRGEAAARHLYRVAAGLDSPVLGDGHILRQLKRAWADARAAGSIGARLNRATQGALAVGKAVRTHTSLGTHGVSLGYATGTLARQVHGDLHHVDALVVGAGDVAQQVMRQLHLRRVRTLHVANRTLEHATRAAARFDAQVHPLDALTEVLPRVNLVVTALRTSAPIIRTQHLRSWPPRTPVVLIDLCMPRAIEATASTHANVTSFNLDDVHHVISGVHAERARDVPHAEAHVERGLHALRHWTEQRAARRVRGSDTTLELALG